LDVLSQPRVKGRIEHVLVKVFALLQRLSLAAHGARRTGQAVRIVDVGKLTDQFRDVAHRVEVQIAEVLSQRCEPLLFGLSRKVTMIGLPGATGVRKTKDKKRLVARCHQTPFAAALRERVIGRLGAAGTKNSDDCSPDHHGSFGAS
jgi:hypothetical protein